MSEFIIYFFILLALLIYRYKEKHTLRKKQLAALPYYLKYPKRCIFLVFTKDEIQKEILKLGYVDEFGEIEEKTIDSITNFINETKGNNAVTWGTIRSHIRKNAQYLGETKVSKEELDEAIIKWNNLQEKLKNERFRQNYYNSDWSIQLPKNNFS